MAQEKCREWVGSRRSKLDPDLFAAREVRGPSLWSNLHQLPMQGVLAAMGMS